MPSCFQLLKSSALYMKGFDSIFMLAFMLSSSYYSCIQDVGGMKSVFIQACSRELSLQK